jgi:hypothetical protein
MVGSGIGHLHRAALQRPDHVHHGKESPNRDGSKGRRGPVAELRPMGRERGRFYRALCCEIVVPPQVGAAVRRRMLAE